MDPFNTLDIAQSLRYRCYRLREAAKPWARHQCGSLAQRASILLHRARRSPDAGGLIILDDYFPNLLTGFRIAEFNEYLERFPTCHVYTSDPKFAANQPEYAQRFPHLAPRVLPWSRYGYLRGRLAYGVFLRNTFEFLPAVEAHRLPFVFTLYPGGGFRLNDDGSDRMLRRVCESACFRGVIATQTVTRDYLIERHFCDPSQVHFIFGGVFPSDVFATGAVRKQYFGQDKETLDICFVAHKYMAGGIDKGYDTFVEVARILAAEMEHARFHVIGGFGPDEIDVSDLGDRIRFYGSLYREEFTALYGRMDLILSPNRPFRLFPGSFDGFPTGCCIEAGLSGVAVFATDPLGCNIAFEDGAEIVLVPAEPRAIADRVHACCQDPERLYRIAAGGQRAFARLFDLEAQMGPRMKTLSHWMQPAPAASDDRHPWDACAERQMLSVSEPGSSGG